MNSLASASQYREQAAGQAPSNGQEARPLTIIEEREASLSAAVDFLNESINRLQCKVARTLTPEEPCEVPGKGICAGPVVSEQAEFLSIQEIRVRDASRWIENIISRCQL